MLQQQNKNLSLRILANSVKVIITKPERLNSCLVKFTLSDGTILKIEDEQKYDIGGVSVKAWGLYHLLVDIGFDKNESYKIFDRDIEYLTICKVPRDRL